MAVPFGFSVGDFIAVGRLIQKITVELRENGEAAPEYQHLLIELESLDRVLKQVQTLQPKKHELLQLTAIKATALTCQIPLQQFLNKISKFDQRLGITNVGDQRFRGFYRRMQWRLAYKDEVQALRTKLGSHVATISLLLMTQAVSSITTAEHDRAEATCGLQEKILAYRRLLEDVQTGVDSSLSHQLETKSQLERQEETLDILDRKVDRTIQQLHDEHDLIQEVISMTSTTEEHTKSVLAITTDTLSQATQGLLTLRDLAMQLYDLVATITRFTVEMQESIALLMRQFGRICSMLHTLQGSLATRICPPIVQFTDALGETLALPYQMCRQWKTFRLILSAIFDGRPGKSRVERGDFLIMHAAGGRCLLEDSWNHAIRDGDHLQMSIVLDDFLAEQDSCPFPSCKASLLNAEASNGGRTCPQCSRWVLLTKLESHPGTHVEDSPNMNHFDSGDSNEEYTDEETSDEEKDSPPEEHIVDEIELYRNISVTAAGVQQQPYNASTAIGLVELLDPIMCWATLSNKHNRSPIDFKVHKPRDFKPSQVLEMLWTPEPASKSNATEDSSYSWYRKHGIRVYSKPGRFVIISSDHQSCQCLRITTYQGRATTKLGVNPEHHAIIYTGVEPPGEIDKEKKLRFNPIQVIPKTSRDKLKNESRINYAQFYTLQLNARVRFIGHIALSSQHTLYADFNATWKDLGRIQEEL